MAINSPVYGGAKPTLDCLCSLRPLNPEHVTPSEALAMSQLTREGVLAALQRSPDASAVAQVLNPVSQCEIGFQHRAE